MQKFLTLIFVLFFLHSKGHNAGFEEKCDDIPLPNCTYNWNDITSTDSAFYLVGNSGSCFIYYHKGDVKIATTGTSANLTGVQFINASVGFIWGGGGTLLKTSDGGNSWNPISTNTSDSITKVQFIDENNGFLMLDTVINKTINGGITWVPLTLPSTITFKDFHFFDAQNGQICGNKTSPTLSGYLYSTGNAGGSWNQIYTDTCAFNKLCYTSVNTGYLYGTTSNDPLLLKTTNAGLNWNLFYNGPSWTLGSRVVDYKGLPVFISNEITGSYLYNLPHFNDPNSGKVSNPVTIYSTTTYGIDMIYILTAAGLHRFTEGEITCNGVDFTTVKTPNNSNPYNELAPGKKVKFRVYAYNITNNTITRSVGKIVCRSPYIKLTDSIGIYNNIFVHGGVWTADDDDYEMEISPNTPNNYIMHLEFTFDNKIPAGNTNHSIVDIPLLFSPFSIAKTTFADTATINTFGNGNSIIEPNETIQLIPFITNKSVQEFNLITGYLHSKYSEISIWDNQNKPDGSIGTIHNNYPYEMFNPNDTIQPSSGDYVFTNNFTSVYEIPLTILLQGNLKTLHKDNNGCSYSDYSEITYNWGVDFNLNSGYPSPPIMTPANSVEKNKANYLDMYSVFPNPNNGVFELRSSQESIQEAKSIEIQNTLGQCVYEFVTIRGGSNFRIDISNQPAGLYFLRITPENKTELPYTIKIIKK